MDDGSAARPREPEQLNLEAERPLYRPPTGIVAARERDKRIAWLEGENKRLRDQVDLLTLKLARAGIR